MSMTSARINFTKAAIQALPIPAHGNRAVYHDTQTRGLHVIVTDRGVKTYYVRRKLHGRSERIRLGRFPDLTVEQARGRAGGVHSVFSNGGNPAAVRRRLRGELT